MNDKYTPKQGEYLAFIHFYTKIHGQPPSEADLEQHFRVAWSSVHQMILRLEERGLIMRNPGPYVFYCRVRNFQTSGEERGELTIWPDR